MGMRHMPKIHPFRPVAARSRHYPVDAPVGGAVRRLIGPDARDFLRQWMNKLPGAGYPAFDEATCKDY